MTYCAIGTLSFVDRLPFPLRSTLQTYNDNVCRTTEITGITVIEALTHWLVSRQVVYHDGQDEYWIVENDDQGSDHDSPKVPEPPSLAALITRNSQYVGFNGRCNKLADTCYSFWA